jgi:class 3 adenylate cyclase
VLLGDGQYQEAAAVFGDALGLWRGEPLRDLGESEVARAESARLCELAERAREERIEARLSLGDHEGVIADLEQMVNAAPLRERRWAQLMVALYRCRRQADALRAYQRVRNLLVEELGIEPSADLVSLEEAVLLQKPELDWVRPIEGAWHPPFDTHPRFDTFTRMAGNELPTGVVTFLLTDIEASAQLWETNAKHMADALRRHDGLIEQVVVDHGGVVLKSKGEGDSTLSVFRRASDAIAAAFQLRSALEAEEWPGGVPLRVRTGLHTGEAYERGGDYYGPSLNRAARIQGVAEGGQTLASAATAELLHDRLPSGAVLVDLGQRSLPGPSRRERIFLLTDATDEPALKSGPPGEKLPLPRRVGGASAATELFIGREAETVLLTEALKAACQERRPRVALVNGEPGIGKTSLAVTFARSAHEDGATVLYGAGDEDLASPYQPWRDLLAHLVGNAPACLEPVLQNYAGQLANLGVGSARPAPGSSDAETARYLLFGAVIAVLAAAAEPSGLVVVLEDLHWADAQSLQLLRHLLATNLPAKLLVVGTFREGNATPGSPLASLLAGLHRESGVVRVGLGGLGEAELLMLLEAAAGRPLGEPGMALCDALLAETDGNPFFIVEMLRHLSETRSIYDDPSGVWVASPELDIHGLPVSVREVVRERVARLGKLASSALSAASVIGRDFDLRVLAAATETDDRHLLNCLEAAISSSLVTELGEEQFSFAHALVGRALYDEMSPTRRAFAHRMVAGALEDLHGDDPDRAAEIAAHCMKAATPDHSAKALLYAQRAADHAVARLAPDDARHWYTEALALLKRQPDPGEALDCELRVGLGDAERQCGDPGHRDTLLDAARRAIQLERHDLLVRAALANCRGSFSAAGDVDVEKIEILRAACRAVEGHRSADEAQLLAVLAAELIFAGDYEDCRGIADQALAITRELGDPATLLAVLNYRFTTLNVPFTLVERLAHTAEALELAAGTDDPVQRLRAALSRHVVAWEAANRVEVESMRLMIKDLTGRIRQPSDEFQMGNRAAHDAKVGGDFDEAERLANEMLRIGTESGQPDAFSWSSTHLLEIRREQDRVEEHIPELEAFISQTPRIPGVRMWLARCYSDVGRLDDARGLLASEVANHFSGLPSDSIWRSSVANAADAIAELGWVEAAEVLLPLIRPYADQFATNGTSCTGPVARSLGRLFATVGLLDDAERCFVTSKRISESMRSPLFVAHTHLDWGRVLAASDHPSASKRATPHLGSALTLAVKHGFTLIERKANQALAR